ncbi:MAG TPA: hypothetical protein VL128_09555 [Candidatus Eisenbacteria bacterium]|nr:hypothetical protein [Candidatus Eisenbacteria bacterium]
MKGFRTALAVTCLAFGWLAGCNDYNYSIQYNTGATLTNLSPSGLPAGSGDFVLTVNASQFNGFVCSTANSGGNSSNTGVSVIQWNGTKLASPQCVDTTTMYVTVPGDLISKPGTAYVNTLTPQSGTGNNGLSNTLGFQIYGTPNPVPTITSVTPDSTQPCGTSCGNVAVTITVTGTDFLPSSNNGGSVVTLSDLLTPHQQPAALTITSLSETEIKAVIPGTFLANADTATIQVVNPPNGLCTQPSCLPLVGGGASDNSFCFVIGTGPGGICPTTAQETPAISQDGRYVAYASQQNQANQILLRDTCLGIANGCTPTTQVVSTGPDGTAGNADSHNAVMTPDGRFVAFSSAATNLVQGTPPGRQVYLRDTCIGADKSCSPSTMLISTDASGALNGTEGILPSISTSGRFVAFVALTRSSAEKPAVSSRALAVQSAPNSGLRQVFVRDTCLGASNCTPKTTRISMIPGDSPTIGSKPGGPAISGLAKELALNDARSATSFTPTVAVDDGVFLAATKPQ